MILWRFWIESRQGTLEAVEVRAPSEGQAVQLAQAARPDGVICEVVRRPTVVERRAA